MAKLEESALVEVSLAEAWDLYFDPAGWPEWVEGFGSVESSEGYPEAGGTLVWISTPSGRGTVSERVLEHDHRRRHRIEFSDPQSSGELTTTFAIEGGATRVGLELDYRLARGGPFAFLTDLFFVGGQVRRSLQRALDRFKLAAEDRAAAAAAPPRPADR